MSALSPSQQPTVLFSIYQNNTWTIRCLVYEMIDPAYYIEDCQIYGENRLYKTNILQNSTTVQWQRSKYSISCLDDIKCGVIMTLHGCKSRFLSPRTRYDVTQCETLTNTYPQVLMDRSILIRASYFSSLEPKSDIRLTLVDQMLRW